MTTTEESRRAKATLALQCVEMVFPPPEAEGDSWASIRAQVDEARANLANPDSTTDDEHLVETLFSALRMVTLGFLAMNDALVEIERNRWANANAKRTTTKERMEDRALAFFDSGVRVPDLMKLFDRDERTIWRWLRDARLRRGDTTGFGT